MNISYSNNSKADRLLRRCGSWTEFWKLTRPLDRRTCGDAFERLVQLYLQTQPLYHSKLRHVWRWPEVPDDIRARLKLPAVDEGIDILAETVEGDLWAVQCKFLSDPDRPPTR